jgi:hypothetical protein
MYNIVIVHIYTVVQAVIVHIYTVVQAGLNNSLNNGLDHSLNNGLNNGLNNSIKASGLLAQSRQTQTVIHGLGQQDD